MPFSRGFLWLISRGGSAPRSAEFVFGVLAARVAFPSFGSHLWWAGIRSRLGPGAGGGGAAGAQRGGASRFRGDVSPSLPTCLGGRIAGRCGVMRGDLLRISSDFGSLVVALSSRQPCRRDSVRRVCSGVWPRADRPATRSCLPSRPGLTEGCGRFHPRSIRPADLAAGCSVDKGAVPSGFASGYRYNCTIGDGPTSANSTPRPPMRPTAPARPRTADP